MFKNISKWWLNLNSEYEQINEEFRSFSYGRLHSMIYIFLLTALFAFYKLYAFGVTNAREILNILFDWSLLGFAVIFLLAWFIPFWLINHFKWTRVNFPTFLRTLRWGVETTFDFSISLIFISIVGIALGALDIPFINTENPIIFILFGCAVFFVIILIGLSIFLNKDTAKYKEVLSVVACTSFLFVASTIIYQLVS